MAQFELEIVGALPGGLTRELIQRALGTVRHSHAAIAVEIKFVEPEEMRYLNQTYRKKDESTDILEFPTATATRNEPVVHLGSIVVSATDHLRTLGLDSTLDDWKELLIHGVKNLLHYHRRM